MRKVRLFLCLLFLASGVSAYDFEGYIVGEHTGDQYGTAACAVDLNSDGYPDLAVSAPAADDNGVSSGKVYIYYGGPSADLVADLTLVGDASSMFGQALCSAGDFNHDGAEDLLVGAPFYDLPATSAGAVYLFYGGPSPDATVDHIFTGDAEGDYFGTAVAGVGDMNFDGYDDIAVGAYKVNWEYFVDAGMVYLYFGGPDPDFTADKHFVGTADGERFGSAITAGDFDGDMLPDLAVGAYSFDSTEINQGRVYVYQGGQPIDSLVDLIITGDGAGDKYGWRLSTGLINGDSYDDLIMGSDGFSVDTFETGKVYVFDGGPSFDDFPFYAYSLNRPEADQLGGSLASGVDINDDGRHDMVAGMPGNSDRGTSVGGGMVFAGGSPVLIDTTIFGDMAEEQTGKAAGIWPGYQSAYGVVLGAPAFDEFRGRIHLYRTGGVMSARPPVLDPIGDHSVLADATLSLSVSATDPNWTIPMLSADNLPGTAMFTDYGNGTGVLDWIPALADTGSYTVRFIASDGSLADSEQVVITVTDPAACCTDYTGNVNCDPDDKRNLADISRLIDRVYITRTPLCCEAAGNVNGDIENKINLADISRLIDHVYLSKKPTEPCP